MKKEKKREEKNTTIKYSFFSHEKYQVFSSNLKQVKLLRDWADWFRVDKLLLFCFKLQEKTGTTTFKSLNNGNFIQKYDLVCFVKVCYLSLMPDNSDSFYENIIENNSCTVISLKCKSCEHAKHLQSKCMQK